ncbi:hypothetical protein B296_00050766 [Ensete ventricosum]|uniref:Uncharacterized protein n=1 Tax=Ensete ventricosum TaxID=4639 RepID=A0A426Y659_ENSVE|nr:hypothetical protein B296_00050766 [Ensete ventricosum]
MPMEPLRVTPLPPLSPATALPSVVAALDCAQQQRCYCPTNHPSNPYPLPCSSFHPAKVTSSSLAGEAISASCFARDTAVTSSVESSAMLPAHCNLLAANIAPPLHIVGNLASFLSIGGRSFTIVDHCSHEATAPLPSQAPGGKRPPHQHWRRLLPLLLFTTISTTPLAPLLFCIAADPTESSRLAFSWDLMLLRSSLLHGAEVFYFDSSRRLPLLHLISTSRCYRRPRLLVVAQATAAATVLLFLC